MDPAKIRAVFKHYRYPRSFHEPVPIDPATMYHGRHGLAVHYQRAQTGWRPSERGGYTFCYLYNGNGELVAKGRSDCSPKDNFCYASGRSLALRRALGRVAGLDDLVFRQLGVPHIV